MQQLFLAAQAALYLTLVSDWVSNRHFRILTQIVTFETWDPSDIGLEWCQDKETKRQKDKKTKRQKDKKTLPSPLCLGVTMGRWAARAQAKVVSDSPQSPACPRNLLDQPWMTNVLSQIVHNTILALHPFQKCRKPFLAIIWLPVRVLDKFWVDKSLWSGYGVSLVTC